MDYRRSLPEELPRLAAALDSERARRLPHVPPDPPDPRRVGASNYGSPTLRLVFVVVVVLGAGAVATALMMARGRKRAAAHAAAEPAHAAAELPAAGGPPAGGPAAPAVFLLGAVQPAANPGFDRAEYLRERRRNQTANDKAIEAQRGKKRRAESSSQEQRKAEAQRSKERRTAARAKEGPPPKRKGAVAAVVEAVNATTDPAAVATGPAPVVLGPPFAAALAAADDDAGFLVRRAPGRGRRAAPAAAAAAAAPAAPLPPAAGGQQPTTPRRTNNTHTADANAFQLLAAGPLQHLTPTSQREDFVAAAAAVGAGRRTRVRAQRTRQRNATDNTGTFVFGAPQGQGAAAAAAAAAGAGAPPPPPSPQQQHAAAEEEGGEEEGAPAGAAAAAAATAAAGEQPQAGPANAHAGNGTAVARGGRGARGRHGGRAGRGGRGGALGQAPHDPHAILHGPPKHRLHNTFRCEAGAPLDHVTRHKLNDRVACCYCGSLNWPEERSTHSRQYPEFGLCCSKGLVHMPALQMPPPLITDLLNGTHAKSSQFKGLERPFNTSLGMASSATNVDQTIGDGVKWLSINGTLHHRLRNGRLGPRLIGHRMGPLHPPAPPQGAAQPAAGAEPRAPVGAQPGAPALPAVGVAPGAQPAPAPGAHPLPAAGTEPAAAAAARVDAILGPLPPPTALQPCFAQMYILDSTGDAIKRQAELLGGLDQELYRLLHNMMRDCNPYVRDFKKACDAARAAGPLGVLPPDFTLVIRETGRMDRSTAEDPRRYGAPTGGGEIAAFVPDDASVGPRDIAVHLHAGGVRRISDLNAAYDPLYYVLLFPHGETGWHLGISLRTHEEARAAQRLPDRPANARRNPPRGVAAQVQPQVLPPAPPAAPMPPAPMPPPPAPPAPPAPAQGNNTDAAVPEGADQEVGERRDGDGHESDEGWQGAEDEGSQRVHTDMSCRQFYAYRLMERSEEWNCSNHHLMYRRLTQEYCVDNWVKCENGRLKFYKYNQALIRADQYRGLQDHVNAADGAPVDAASVGQRVVLPSSFVGGPRYMHQSYQDAMAVVRTVGKADLFITVTCNPYWAEILQCLKPGQKPKDRPDLCTRVFRLKLEALLDDIIKHQVLGRVIAKLHVIEFQKRGLPHAHILCVLAPEDKLISPTDYDAVICAELPDKEAEPELYETITTCMIHGPCGHSAQHLSAPCIDAETKLCQKKYPKVFCNATTDNHDGYPVYRRREDGITVEKQVKHMVPDPTDPTKTIKVKRPFVCDNRWVVPYNPCLSKKYNCHINVEHCASIRSIKYLFKYVYKGGDRAQVVMRAVDANAAAAPGAQPQPMPVWQAQQQPVNEIEKYQEGRYISTSESLWRLFGFDMHNQTPPVCRLDLHLPDQQTVRFNETDDLREVAAQPPPRTKLTEWFRLNQRDTKAHSLLYIDIPKFYVWDTQDRCWKPRKQRPNIGRVYSAHPGAGERYYLRLLLNHCRGATCWEDLRTVDGVVCATHKEACERRGLLQDDAEWDQCLAEASTMQSPSQMRALFVTILTHCHPGNATALWAAHKLSLTEDILHRARRHHPEAELSVEMEHEALREVQNMLRAQGQRLADFGFEEPPPAPVALGAPYCKLIQDQLRYDRTALQQRVDEEEKMLNPGQRDVYNAVMAAVKESESPNAPAKSRAFFLYSPGGCGKTFTTNLMLANVRSQQERDPSTNELLPHGKVALAVASSGIAALLMEGGCTAHSRFKIPLNVTNDSVCAIKMQDDQAALLRAAKLIVWDEVSMMHRHCFEAVDRLLREVTRVPAPFGGKVVVCAGDYRQVLPVVKRGTRPGIVAATLPKSTELWSHFVVKRLKVNMRVERLVAEGRDATAQKAFADMLLAIGEGRVGDPWQVPTEMRAVDQNGATSTDPQVLISSVFGDLANDASARQSSALLGRAIMTPKNDDVNRINEMASAMWPGEEHRYDSADEVGHEDDPTLYSAEFLNSLQPQGMPAHRLTLKVGVPIMLLRNLNPALGLANGTRLVISALRPRLIQATILTGTHVGSIVLIPRIQLTPSDTELPFTFSRRQFPIRPAFCMTINKAQGQTFSRVGVYLPAPVFSHGQLYVACSRVGAKEGITIMLAHTPKEGQPEWTTDNVVFTELFTTENGLEP